MGATLWRVNPLSKDRKARSIDIRSARTRVMHRRGALRLLYGSGRGHKVVVVRVVHGPSTVVRGRRRLKTIHLDSTRPTLSVRGWQRGRRRIRARDRARPPRRDVVPPALGPDMEAAGSIRMTWAIEPGEGDAKPSRLVVTSALVPGSKTEDEFNGGVVYIVSGLKTVIETGASIAVA